jgi:hypothetical protein
MRLGLFGVAGLVASAVAPSARAADPLVVVVEVNGGAVDVEGIRDALAEELGRRVLSMFDEGTARATGVLSIAVHHGREEAKVQYRTPEATLLWTTAAFPDDADPAGAWVVKHAAAVVRAAELRQEPTRLTACLEVLDPWRNQPRVSRDVDYRLPPEVLDPFSGPHGSGRMAAYEIPSEVIDPWGPRVPPRRKGGESGDALAPPQPRR